MLKVWDDLLYLYDPTFYLSSIIHTDKWPILVGIGLKDAVYTHILHIMMRWKVLPSKYLVFLDI